ncbi:MAG: DmsC/YnfH family molybdoenzyme membrane anchor subunit [Pseudomonadota bacterium]
MHPAPSIIAFTTLSGLGFGLLVFLGLGLPMVSGITAFWFYLIAFVLSVSGLLSSLGHLGNPQRAWKAFSQWRTSWLSREGVLAVATLGVMGSFALGRVFELYYLPWLGWIGATLSFVTVFATSMIYAQLKTVPRWNHWTTPVQFMLFAMSGGALLGGQMNTGAGLATISAAFQILNWYMGDTRFKDRGHTQETATGLGDMGSVQMFEPPHTGTNYLLKEMVHQIGRKHSQKLRRIGVGLAILPLFLLVTPFSHALAGGLVLVHIAGVVVIRWLFFAEAEHVVGLYYGAHSRG